MGSDEVGRRQARHDSPYERLGKPVQLVTQSVIESLGKWKNILEQRFEQRAIYMRLSEHAIWL